MTNIKAVPVTYTVISHSGGCILATSNLEEAHAAAKNFSMRMGDPRKNAGAVVLKLDGEQSEIVVTYFN